MGVMHDSVIMVMLYVVDLPLLETSTVGIRVHISHVCQNLIGTTILSVWLSIATLLVWTHRL